MSNGGDNEPTRGAVAAQTIQTHPAWQPWTALAGFAVLVNFAWEMAQMPLFRMRNPSGWAMLRECTQATAGDMMLTLVAYGVAALCIRRLHWLLAPRPMEWATFLGVGLAATVGLEWWNVMLRHSWAYSAAMPTVAGIGLAPVIQWLVLPPLILWLARRHMDAVEQV